MQNGRLGVMQVVSNLNIGGAQEVVRTLAEHLAAAGCNPVVCAFQDGPLRQEIERLGIPVEILPARRYGVVALPLFVTELFQMRQALVRLVKKHRVNVIQTHLLRSLDFLVLTLRFQSDLRVFWTVQNARFTLREDHLARHKWLLRPKQWAYRLLYRASARWVNRFIAVSDEVKTALVAELGPLQDKIAVICNSVDVERYRQTVDRAAIRRQLGLAEDAHLMAVVATFKRQKGHGYLVEAAAGVIPQAPNFHLLFVGDGELREELQTQTRRLGLEKHIHFLGLRSDVPALLAASDYFVLPSLWEGLSMALVEAMASGLPIIATAVSGTTQVMIPGETGLLVPPGDVDGLKQAILRLLADPARARAMGAAARQHVAAQFGAEKQAADHIALYRQAFVSRN